MKKRIVSIALVLLLVFLAGCGSKGDARDAFHTMMAALKTGDVETIKPYYDFAQESNFTTITTADEMLQVVLATLKEIEYQVEEVEQLDGNTVQITAKVTTLDFTQIINLYLEQLMTMVGDEAYQSQVSGMEQGDYQKLVADKMTELLTTEEIETEEKTVMVTMVKQEDGTWVPGADKADFYGALFVNLIDAVNSLI